MAADELVVGGIAFNDPESANKARTEQKRIDALNKKMDYEDVNATLSLYQKARDNQVFTTPVGIAYLMRLQDYLYEKGVDESLIAPIILPRTGADAGSEGMKAASGEGGLDSAGSAQADAEGPEGAQGGEHPRHPMSEEVFRTRLEAQKQKVAQANKMIKYQWYVMIAMAVIILAMFVISLTGNNPTIVNYRSKILNQYSEWEQELREREAAVSIKEQGSSPSAGASAESTPRVIDTE